MKVQFIWTSDTSYAEELILQKVEIFPGELEEIASIENTFFSIRDGFCIGDYTIPAFVNGKCAREQDLFEDKSMLNLIDKLCKENSTEVVLVCDYKFFKECLYFSKKGEMEAKMLVTEEKGMLHYAAVATKKCALLISYDIYCE